MYECDYCGKQFSDTRGAFLGKICPPMYDQLVVCKECCIKIEDEEKKRQERKDDFLE